MLLGAHESVAGGAWNAIARGRADGCEALQIFARPSAQWRAKPMDRDEISMFRSEHAAVAWPVMSHASYLINLASPDQELFQRSLDAFVLEMERAEELGLKYLVTHPGSPCGSDEPDGLARVARALDEVHRRCAGFGVKVLLENTAGQGSCLGHRFEHLAAILARLKEPERVGVCFGPLDRSEQARLLRIPARVDERTRRTPSLLQQRADRLRLRHHRDVARQRIPGPVHPTVAMIAADHPFVRRHGTD